MNRSYFLRALLALPFVPSVLAKLKPGSPNVLVAFRQETDFATVPTQASAILRPTIRYGLCPGWVTDPVVGSQWGVMRTHYVSAPELARLYRVRLEECVIFRVAGPDHPMWIATESYEGSYAGLIMLRPRADGDYTLDAFALRFAHRAGRRTI